MSLHSNWITDFSMSHLLSLCVTHLVTFHSLMFIDSNVWQTFCQRLEQQWSFVNIYEVSKYVQYRQTFLTTNVNALSANTFKYHCYFNKIIISNSVVEWTNSFVFRYFFCFMYICCIYLYFGDYQVSNFSTAGLVFFKILKTQSYFNLLYWLEENK